MPLTITEALADLKTLDKRIAAKRASIMGDRILARQDGFKDPITEDGGSREFVRRERQAIADLEARKVAIRMAIQRANQSTPVTVEGITRSVAEWLTWRKEIAPGATQFLGQMRDKVTEARRYAQQKGWNVAEAGASATQPSDLVVSVDDAELYRDIEAMETVLGALDGQLSLKNATVLIDL